MSEMAKRVLGSFARRADQTSPLGGEQPSSGVDATTITLQVRVPRAMGRGSEELTDVLHDRLDMLVQDLAVARSVDVVVVEHSHDAVTASLGGHPLRHVDVAHLRAHNAMSLIGRQVMDGALRRLPLLSGGAPAAGYLADVGCRPGDLGGVDMEVAELAIDARTEERIEVEVATSTLRCADREARDAVVHFRNDERQDFGTVYPDLRLVPVDAPEGTVRLRLNDIWLPPYLLDEGAGWADVVEFVAREVTERRHWFLRTRDVSASLDNDLAYLLPDLVDVTKSNFSPPLLTACLRELLRNRKRIRNLPRILWMLLEQGDRPPGPDMVRLAESPLLPRIRNGPRADKDPVLLAARVRKLANEEAWRLGNYVTPTNAYRLPLKIETALTDPELGVPALCEAEWAAVRAVAATADVNRVVTRTIQAIGPVREALQAVSRPPRVTASQELPPDADVTMFPTLNDPRSED